MSLSTLLGLDKIGDQTVKDAQTTVTVAVDKLSPLFRDIENRFGGILHGLLDRVKFKFSCEIEILPIEKAEPVPLDKQ